MLSFHFKRVSATSPHIVSLHNTSAMNVCLDLALSYAHIHMPSGLVIRMMKNAVSIFLTHSPRWFQVVLILPMVPYGTEPVQFFIWQRIKFFIMETLFEVIRMYGLVVRASESGNFQIQKKKKIAPRRMG